MANAKRRAAKANSEIAPGKRAVSAPVAGNDLTVLVTTLLPVLVATFVVAMLVEVDALAVALVAADALVLVLVPAVADAAEVAEPLAEPEAPLPLTMFCT